MRQSLTDLMHSALHKKSIEPQKRVKCLHHVKRGHRNIAEPASYISHIYPIKGGISNMQLMAENITRSNTLLARLLGR